MEMALEPGDIGADTTTFEVFVLVCIIGCPTEAVVTRPAALHIASHRLVNRAVGCSAGSQANPTAADVTAMKAVTATAVVNQRLRNENRGSLLIWALRSR